MPIRPKKIMKMKSQIDTKSFTLDDRVAFDEKTVDILNWHFLCNR